MVVYEEYKKNLIKAYSTEEFYITRDNILYEEAIDLKSFGYKYEETDIPIEHEENKGEDFYE